MSDSLEGKIILFFVFASLLYDNSEGERERANLSMQSVKWMNCDYKKKKNLLSWVVGQIERVKEREHIKFEST